MINKKNSIYLIILFLLLIFTILYQPLTVNASTIDSDYEDSIVYLKKEQDVVNIDSVGLQGFTNIKYIENANYFLVNPKHAINDGSDNEAGTCTTVAVQLLMGYHNYYSDRRLIPSQGSNDLIFLSHNYGDINEHPSIKTNFTYGQGRASIGTEDGVYRELLDLTWISNWYGIGQAVGLVKDGALRFVDKYAKDIKESVTITSGFFSESEARAEIDAGRPIVLGFFPLFTGADSFHVVPAYGYATLDGIQGFIVHYGWGDVNTHVWVPSSWLGFQIKMEVDHEHDLVDTGVNINNTYRKLSCTTCGYATVDNLYEVDTVSPQKIVGVNYPLSGDVVIPTKINGITITEISTRAFYGCAEIESATIPSSITKINTTAFGNCINLEDVMFVGSSQLSTISDEAFSGCTKLSKITIPATVTSIGEHAFASCINLQGLDFEWGSQLDSIEFGAFYNCASLTSIDIPASVRVLGYQVFRNCYNLEQVSFSTNSQLINIGIQAFHCCSNLTSITIPATVEIIGSDAFNACYNLHTVLFEEDGNLTLIENYTFFNCKKLNNIIIPSEVTYIGVGAFRGCTELTNAYFERESKLNTVKINAFYECSSLTKIDIPSSVISICEGAFYGCTNLEKVIMYNQTSVPVLGTDCFSATPKNLKIYVSNELFDNYLASPYWDAYEGKLEVAYFDEFGAYICGDDVETISMEDYIYCETLYKTDWEEDGFLTGQMAIIGFNLSEYFAHCFLDYYSNAVFSCNLKIEVEEQSGRVLLFDSERNYVCEGEIENGILTIPFTEIWNDSREFYLFPDEGSVDIIEFLPKDVSLEVTYKEYL